MKSIYLVFIILFGINNIHAQKNKDSITTKVIVFDESDYKSIDEVTGKKKWPKNAVKLGLGRIVYGELPIYYEREVSDVFLIQFGAGITFRNFYYDLNIFGRNNRDYTQNMYDYRKSTTGYCVNIMPKFSIGSNGMEGGYIGLPFTYSVNKYKAQKVDANYEYIDDYAKETLKSIYFSIDGGWNRPFEHLILDLSVGFGLWFRTDNRLFPTYNSTIYNNEMFQSSRLTPLINFNLSFGGIF